MGQRWPLLRVSLKWGGQIGPGDVWVFEVVYYVAGDVFEEESDAGDVRDHSEPEAGWPGPEPSGEPFAEDDEHLARRNPKLWRQFGADPLV